MPSFNYFKRPPLAFLNWSLRLLAGLFFCINSQLASAQPLIKVAVAANFQATLRRLANSYSQQQNQKILISSASSGKHFAQINHGAGFDLFLSADITRAELLEQQNNIQVLDRQIYAYGQLAWACNKPCRDYAITDNSMPSTAEFSRWNIALANAKLAPYGLASEYYLAAQELQPRKKIRAENVRQTFQFLLSGNVDLALVAKSNAIAFYTQAPEHYQAIDPKLHPLIEQQMVLISNKARGFFQFIRSDQARTIIQQDGYLVPKLSRSGN